VLLMIRSTTFLVFLLLALAGPSARGEDSRTPELEARMTQARERLELSDEQVERMAPVLEASITERRRILAEYGVDLDSTASPLEQLGFRRGRAMRREMEAVRSDTRARLEDILDAGQLAEFERMQDELREEMRDRMRGRASAP
jgi:Na+-transporting methylmalonyl-CoA/oxaloacetate decarboxylase gamma subunit